MRAIRLISSEIYAPHSAQAYFEEMERKGFRLDAAGSLLLYFDRAEPRTMHYRLEYDTGDLPEELLAQYRDCGWAYAAQVGRRIHIFRAPEGTPCPSDSGADGYRRYFRQSMWTGSWIVGSVLATLMILCAAAGVDAYFNPESSWFLTIATILLLVGFGYVLSCSARMYQHWKSLCAGRSQTGGNSRRYRVGMWISAVCLLFYLGTMGYAVKNLLDDAMWTGRDRAARWQPVSEMAEQLDAQGLPYFTLDDLGVSGGETWEQMSGIYPHQPLTRVQYAWRMQTQRAAREDDESLELACYDVRVPLLDRALADSLRRDNAYKVETDAFDSLYRYDGDGYLLLTARAGHTVTNLYYAGKATDQAQSLFCETFGRPAGR